MSEFLSIIVATRNRDQHLLDCLSNLNRQHTNFAFEIIVVDQSSSISRINFSKWPNVKYFHVDFIGLSKARNFGIRRSRGSIISLMDDDATVDHDFVDSVYEIVKAHPKYKIFCGIVIDPSNGQYFTRDMNDMEVEVDLLHFDRCVSTSMIIRKSIFIDIGYFDVRMGAGCWLGSSEEADLVIRSILDNNKILATPDIVVYHPADSYNSSTPHSIVTKGLSYGRGRGFLIRKHILKSPTFLFFHAPICLLKAVLGALLCLCKFNFRGLMWYLSLLLGRIDGLVMPTRKRCDANDDNPSV